MTIRQRIERIHRDMCGPRGCESVLHILNDIDGHPCPACQGPCKAGPCAACGQPSMVRRVLYDDEAGEVSA